jgi:hypothetical protein
LFWLLVGVEVICAIIKVCQPKLEKHSEDYNVLL